MSTVTTIVPATTSTVTGAWFAVPSGTTRKVQAYVVGTGAVTGTVIFEGSTDGVGIGATATMTLSGTTTDSTGFATVADWAFVRARVTALSGTGATITVTLEA